MALARIPPAAMMRAGDPHDPRAQRTRVALLSEFERQLGRGGMPPSVTSVIQGAAVSRSAFYAHFASIEDLHAAAVRLVLENFGVRPAQRRTTRSPDSGSAGGVHAIAAADEDTQPELTRLPYETLFEHIHAHRHLFATALTSGASAGEQLRHALSEQCRHAIDHAPARPLGVDSGRAATFVAGGVLASVTQWLADPGTCSARQLAQQVTALMPPWLVGSPSAQATVEVTFSMAPANRKGRPRT